MAQNQEAMQSMFVGVLRILERGMVLTRYYSKRKQPEKRMFSVKLETRQLVWKRSDSSNQRPEGMIDLREVRYIRGGKGSKDFERCQESARNEDINCCFIVFYGLEFKLKRLSVVARNVDEYNKWFEGLQHLVQDTQASSHAFIVERWLRKEYYTMEIKNGSVGLKEIKSWMPRLNVKVDSSRLKTKYQEVLKSTGDMHFEAFVAFYHSILHQDSVFEEHCGQFFSRDRDRMSEAQFQNFLTTCQKESAAESREWVRMVMKNFLCDTLRSAQDLYFTKHEFLDFLHSKHSSLFDESYNEVNQDMDQPLSHYWIDSSHNTYLTGDQVYSDSSCEAYARVLKSGCRCIELDCWDGPDNMPTIYHGHTLTSKIRFIDVLRTIKEYAWVASEYPLILSIENHCNLTQQRNMANSFREVFGDSLLTEVLDPNATCLPSPNQLKRKILLKHKKLPEGVDSNDFPFSSQDESNVTEADLSNSIKNGIMHLQDPQDQEWKPHFFVLTPTKLHYTEETKRHNADNDEDDDDGEDETTALMEVPSEELHFSEPWFHGNVGEGHAQQGRQDAESRLKYAITQGYPDGTFLVRHSCTFVGDFTLSFLHASSVQHCRIHRHNMRSKYYLVETKEFDNLYNLVEFYRSQPLQAHQFHQKLTAPCPQPQKHEDKPWYHDNLSRSAAEGMLRCINTNGAFLVRKRPEKDESDSFQYTLSFRAFGHIKHCRIKQEGRLFTIGRAQFEDLCNLVTHYQSFPLYKDMTLKIPVNESVIGRNGQVPQTQMNDPDYGVYTVPNDMLGVKVRALYDYTGREGDLSFCAHAIITNVIKQDGMWWRGDHGNVKCGYFPVNYVEDIHEDETTEDSDSTPLGSLQKGTIQLRNCNIEAVPRSPGGTRGYMFRISNAYQLDNDILISCDTQAEMEDWMKRLGECSNIANIQDQINRRNERSMRIAKEFSNLIAYCRSVQFDVDKPYQANCLEMSSFPETRVESWVKRSNPAKSKTLLKYNRLQLSRVYPKGQRIDSSNYDPLPAWNTGCHMLALNCQTGDKYMQLNEGRFLQNGSCGYVLQPSCIRSNADFCPFNKNTAGVEPLTLSIKIISARHLPKNGRNSGSSFVEVEIVGAHYDCNNKYKTRARADNGFNPVWNEALVFDVINPELALIRFVVQDEDIFADPNFIGQATYPVPCLKSGYRSVPLKNAYSEDLELASLLIHISMANPKEECNDIYSSILELRENSERLQTELDTRESHGDMTSADVMRIRQQLGQTEQQLLAKNMERLARVRGAGQQKNGRRIPPMP